MRKEGPESVYKELEFWVLITYENIREGKKEGMRERVLNRLVISICVIALCKLLDKQ